MKSTPILQIGGRCRSGRHAIETPGDLYTEPSTGNIRCARCFRANRNRARTRQRTTESLEPDVEIVRRSEIPPAGRAKVEQGTWDRVVRRTTLLGWDEALRVTCVGVGSESSLRDAAKRLGIPITVVHRGGALWIERKRAGRAAA